MNGGGGVGTILPEEPIIPAEVIAMPVAEFRRRFGFQPIDKLEKYVFAITGKRLKAGERKKLKLNLEPDLTQVGW